MPPVVYPIPVDRSSDLFGAWRLDGPLVAMELKTDWVERNADEIEQLSRFTFRIVDQLLID